VPLARSGSVAKSKKTFRPARPESETNIRAVMLDTGHAPGLYRRTVRSGPPATNKQQGRLPLTFGPIRPARRASLDPGRPPPPVAGQEPGSTHNTAVNLRR